MEAEGDEVNLTNRTPQPNSETVQHFSNRRISIFPSQTVVLPFLTPTDETILHLYVPDQGNYGSAL